MPALLPPRRFLLCLLTLLALSGCEQPANVALDQQVYIWQRQWRPAHAQALADSRADFSTLRVLAAQLHPREGWVTARLDPALLRQDGRPLIAVIRLDGQLPQLDTASIGVQIKTIVSAWQASGLNLRGVEIDHDCASSRLPAYAELLHTLRRELPRELPLSITALPAWLTSPTLVDVLREVDSSVLQVHAINRPEAGLFDAPQALRWANAYGAVNSKPFHLALPAYGVALTENGDVESEAPLPQGGARRELQAKPEDVATLLRDMQAAPIPHLAGLIWFRLPLAGDRRAWPLATLQAVLHQQPLRGDIQVTVQQQGELYELRLVNSGNLNAPLPARIYNDAARCESGDGVQGYRLHRASNTLEFVRQPPGQLAAGQSRVLGWLRCSQLDHGGFRVSS
ncbi:DUF3142 domain-containing protein [Pseudomonas sp. GV071]|uniref:DUF3142 domain-containing protein n=1 Tax=Pseudomonas sp. GV071 TaxID=2135754 RepID=UPI000D41CDBE|nr:DUF3142 domain-containing protein [Pseudomonas sp. GV071]PTQ67626.1 uncharacterized protein DUF3142 [Pseudomonas sp. GV071]